MLAIHDDTLFSNEKIIDELFKKPRNLDIMLKNGKIVKLTTNLFCSSLFIDVI